MLKRIAVVACAAWLGLHLTAVQPAVAQESAGEESAADYPDLPGRDETFAFCTGCHNFKIVAAQGMNRSRWDNTLTWMTEVHGMADIQGEPRDLILDYLAEAFPERTQRGWQNPFAR